MERLTFKIKDNLGNDIILEGIATYHDDETNKDFIVYTDKTFDENGKLKVYYALYKMVNNAIQLIETKTIDEKRVGLELIKEIINSIDGTK